MVSIMRNVVQNSKHLFTLEFQTQRARLLDAAQRLEQAELKRLQHALLPKLEHTWRDLTGH